MKKLVFVFLISISGYIYLTREQAIEVEPSESRLSTAVRKEISKDLKPEGTNIKIDAARSLHKKSHDFKREEVITNQEKVLKEPLVFDIDSSFESTEYYDRFLDAYKNRNNEAVIEFGENLLKIPDRYSSYYWYGNLCHAVHIILGKTYMTSDNVEKAEYHLLKSVSNKCIEKSFDKKYSPQLSSFGPDRSLAFSLYEKGRVDSVVKFFELTKKFWDEGVEDGTIDKAIKNLLTTELSYEQEDDPNFPFMPVAYIINYEKAPMAKRIDN